MNERGISWCISLIESYINPVFIVSNFDQKMMNYTMREVVRVIFNSLCLRYKEFDMKKSDIPRVANEMLSRYSFLEKGAVIADEVVEEKEKGEEEKKGTPLKGLKHLGDATLEKLETYGITTREVFFEKLATEKEVMKKLMTPIVFSKFIL